MAPTRIKEFWEFNPARLCSHPEPEALGLTIQSKVVKVQILLEPARGANRERKRNAFGVEASLYQKHEHV